MVEIHKPPNFKVIDEICAGSSSGPSPRTAGFCCNATSAVAIRNGVFSSIRDVAQTSQMRRVGVWRGGLRLSMSVCRPFRLAVP